VYFRWKKLLFDLNPIIMKKLLLITGIIPIIMSFNVNGNKKATNAVKIAVSVTPTPSTMGAPVEITLNGIKKADADKMFCHFLKFKGQDKSPVKKSIWFDSVTFHRIVVLLNKERGADPANGVPDRFGQTDGMRVYFISDTTISSGKLNNSIMLVSTKNNGPSTSVPSKARHLSYYEHDAKDILFTENANTLKGITSTRYPHKWGENLYLFGIYKDDVSSCDEPDYTSRKRAYKMVNQFGNDTIRTEGEWFSIKLLRLLDRSQHDGIRIYFCRHPEKNGKTADTDVNKENFVLVSTQLHTHFGKSYHADVFNCKATHAFFMEKNNLEWYRHHKFYGNSGGGDDNGELCPTHCN
jgi:hypothetical protein